MNLNSYIARQFSNPTGIGGRVISFVMNKQNQPLYIETLQLLTPNSNDRILDIGCGNGHVMDMIASQNDCKLTGIDPSKSIIKAALRHYHKFVKDGQMDFLCQGVSSMSFTENSFSKAYTINTVYFWEDINDTMVKVERVLKPNGVFLNTFYSAETLAQFSHTQYGYKRFDVEHLITAGQEAKLEVRVVPILNKKAYCIIYRKPDRMEFRK